MNVSRVVVFVVCVVVEVLRSMRFKFQISPGNSSALLKIRTNPPAQVCPRSFLEKQVDIVNPQWRKFLVRTLKRHQKTTKARKAFDNLTILHILKLINLPMANIIPHICQRALIPYISPSLARIILIAIQAQRARHQQREMLSLLHREQLNIDIERQRGLGVGGDSRDARNAIVFRLVVVGDSELVLEEGRVAACCHFLCGGGGLGEGSEVIYEDLAFSFG